MHLIVDLGGTKIRFAPVSDSLRIQGIYTYKSREFKNFFQALEHFLKESYLKNINTAVIAVAGPVINGKSLITNLNWKINKFAIQNKFGFERVFLLNDLEALAWSYFILNSEDFWWLKKEKNKKYPALFIAPGTGLGISFVTKANDNPVIFPTEAGHVLFSPLKNEEFEFITFLKKKKRTPSWENALSGKGLMFWYEFFTNKKLKPEEITSLALQKERQAQRAVRKIMELLGRKCALMALSVLPKGGIYLAGGLINGLTEFFLKKSYFKTFFNAYFSVSRKLEYLLDLFSIALILPQDPVILGGLSILRNQLR